MVDVVRPVTGGLHALEQPAETVLLAVLAQSRVEQNEIVAESRRGSA